MDDNIRVLLFDRVHGGIPSHSDCSESLQVILMIKLLKQLV